MKFSPKTRYIYHRGKRGLDFLAHLAFYIASSIFFIVMLKELRNQETYKFVDTVINPDLMNVIKNNKVIFGIVFGLLVYFACLHLMKSIACMRLIKRIDISYFQSKITISPRNSIFNPLNSLIIPEKETSTSCRSIFQKGGHDNYGVRKFLGAIGFVVNRVVLGALLSLAIMDLVQTFQGNSNILGIHVLPEFITNNNTLLICAAVAVGIMSIFFLFNTIVDLSNLVKIETNLLLNKQEKQAFDAFLNNRQDNTAQFLNNNTVSDSMFAKITPKPHLDDLIVGGLERIVGLL